MPFPNPPEPFLSVEVHDISKSPTICALCAGYEGGKWRAKDLANHAMEWLPEFCLSTEELEGFKTGTAYKLIQKAARLVYQTDKYKLRGEFGELFLHIVLRQVHKSIPAITKMYWKDSVNSTIKGYDAVHVVETEEKLELWLGEVKFYNNASRAIRDVVDEIQRHVQIDYMKNEVALIAHKLDRNSPHYPRLSKLFDMNTSLDKIFDCACIPILITYDSSVLKTHTKATPEYSQDLANEVMLVRANLEKMLVQFPLPMRVHLFLIPLNTKKTLQECLDGKLKGLQ
jgi:hypothetical protein